MQKKSSQKGQVILVLMLVMSVALAIGLSIVQRSLTDISTASKVEQSSRAFSVAEAGVEKALSGDPAVYTEGVDFSEDNSATAKVQTTGEIPAIPLMNPDGTYPRQTALEFPPLTKEEMAHIWFADQNSLSNPPALFYQPPDNSIEVYWGTTGATDKPALSLSIVYYDGEYKILKKYYDPDTFRAGANGFIDVSGNCSSAGYTIETTSFLCKKTVDALPPGLILMRARLLYNSTSQGFAVWATGICGKACSLPPQAQIYLSSGISGETERSIQVFEQKKVLPLYLDYAIFSTGEVKK